jgi:MOSC domain-containing protein YiiM
MRTFDELEDLWKQTPSLPTAMGTVRFVCVRKPEGHHETPKSVKVTSAQGVEGDRWADNPRRDPQMQVTLMRANVAELIAADHAPLDAPGDNFLVDLDLSEQSLPAGTQLQIGTAVLEISVKPHTGCKKFSTRFGLDALKWVNHEAKKELHLRGVNCRVVQDGVVAVGDAIRVL